MICAITANKSLVTWAASCKTSCYKTFLFIFLISYLCIIILSSVGLANILMMTRHLTFLTRLVWSSATFEWWMILLCTMLTRRKIMCWSLLTREKWEPDSSFFFRFFFPLSPWFDWTSFAGTTPSINPSNLISLRCSCAYKEFNSSAKLIVDRSLKFSSEEINASNLSRTVKEFLKLI